MTPKRNNHSPLKKKRLMDASGNDTLGFISDFLGSHRILPAPVQRRYLELYKAAQAARIQLLDAKKEIEEKLESEDCRPSERASLVQELKQLEDFLHKDLFLKQEDKYRNKLIEYNLRLVVTVASTYSNKGVDFDDLFQEGIFGFIRALEKFNPDRGIKLGTYATWWIRQRITRYLSNHARLIRLPVHIGDDVTKVLIYIKKNSDVDADYDSIEAISTGTGLTPEQVELSILYINTFHPLNHSIKKDGADDVSITDTLIDNEYHDEALLDGEIAVDFLKDQINDALRKIPADSQWFLTARYGLGIEKTHSYQEMENVMKPKGIITSPKHAIRRALYELAEQLFINSRKIEE